MKSRDIGNRPLGRVTSVYQLENLHELCEQIPEMRESGPSRSGFDRCLMDRIPNPVEIIELIGNVDPGDKLAEHVGLIAKTAVDTYMVKKMVTFSHRFGPQAGEPTTLPSV
jgi:hypothetical protein